MTDLNNKSLQELFDILPPYIVINDVMYFLVITKDWVDEGYFILKYEDENHIPYLISKGKELNKLIIDVLPTLNKINNGC